ncbi:MAG: nucleoside triphosphate pyrophosphohydrolase [Deltaproteobacteria bacterium]|nr:nucleoside triphosphate pyrophosphohydrolase [Deltaproteobacteria bacterium]
MKSQSQPVSSVDPGRKFAALWQVICKLRSDEGCPWDREQTFASMKNQFLDEVYEFIDALEEDDATAMAEELGDLFFHLLFFCRLGEDGGRFVLDEVLERIRAKLIRRHPHVFAAGEMTVSSEEVKANWEKIKREQEGKEYASLLDGVPVSLPPLLKAYTFGRKAAGVGFDWPDAAAVLPKLREEMAEVEEVLAEGGVRLEEELGDLLFVTVNLVRLAGYDPGRVLDRANRKFESRFRRMEEMASEAGTGLAQMELEKQERLWSRAKREEKSPDPVENFAE